MELVAKVGFCVWLAAFYNLATAQEENKTNLIYNGSFEQHSACPQKIEPYGYMSEVDAWWQPTGGSSDYYNPCGGETCIQLSAEAAVHSPSVSNSTCWVEALSVNCNSVVPMLRM